jgi:hypothetical protein
VNTIGVLIVRSMIRAATWLYKAALRMIGVKP